MTILEEYIEGQGLGRIERLVQLKTVLDVPRGASGPAHLVQTEKGIFLAAAWSPDIGRAIDLTAVSMLRYESGWIADAIVVDTVPHGIPARQGAAVKEIIAIGRLLASAPETRRTTAGDPDNRYVERGAPHEEAWLTTRLQSGEAVLAWLETGTQTETGSSIVPGVKAWWRYLLTDRRALRVAVSEVGDVVVREVPGVLVVEDRVGRDTITGGGATWVSSLKNDVKYQEIAAVPAEDPVARTRTIAFLNYARRGAASASVLAAVHLLERLADAGVATKADEALLALALDEENVGSVAAKLAGMPREDLTALTSWCESVRVDDDYARRLLLELLGLEQDPTSIAAWSAGLHEQVRSRLQEKDTVALAGADIELAEHLLVAGRRDDAAQVLEARLELLPDQELEDILPADGDDLTAGQGGQYLRIRVLELLVAARSGEDRDVATLAELARLQPLVASHLSALAEVSDGALKDRAATAVALLEAGGVALGEPPDVPASVRPLSLEQIEQIKHPMARSSGVFGWLQSRVAKVAAPDHSAVRAYAERATAGPLVDALTDAAVALGGASPTAYVSRGEKSLGMQSFEEPEPFLLVGADHVAVEGPYSLTASEMAFAVGAELAHLRFGHSRITNSEVWDGTWDVGLQAANLFGTVLTFGGANIVASMLGRRDAFAAVTRVVTPDTLKKAAGVGGMVHTGADYAEQGRGIVDGVRSRADTGDSEIGKKHEEVLAAHRVMQLTADRVGLVMCGDLRSAVRAMFLTQKASRDELALAERHGVATSLGRRDSDGRVMLQDLAVRTAALISFWLSEEYPQLLQALRSLPE